MSRIFLTAVLCLMTSAHAAAQQSIATLASGDKNFISAEGLAASLDMKLEVIQPNKMITFCSNGKNAICIPVQLTKSNSIHENDKTFLLKSEAESILSVEISMTGKSAFASPKKSATSIDLSTGYNSAWPKGRGFSVGETVPDIPLVNMGGQEVRFSEYLGKRYILYCWASW